MHPYKNLGGNSNVEAYEIGDDSILVKFRRGAYCHYLYTYESCGKDEVEKMKTLAEEGQGLGGFLATNPYHKEAKKW